MTCLALPPPLFPLQTCDDAGALLSPRPHLLFHLPGAVFVDCLINWKELTWEIDRKTLSREVSQQKLTCAHGSLPSLVVGLFKNARQREFSWARVHRARVYVHTQTRASACDFKELLAPGCQQ